MRFEHVPAREHFIWFHVLWENILLQKCTPAFHKILHLAQSTVKICQDYWMVVYSCLRIFYIHRMLVRHIRVFRCSSIHFLLNIRRKALKQHQLRPESSSMLLIRSHSTPKQAQNFDHLMPVNLILGRAQQTWGALQGKVFIRWLRGNFISLLYLFGYHLRVELQMLFFVILTLNGLRLKIW